MNTAVPIDWKAIRERLRNMHGKPKKIALDLFPIFRDSKDHQVSEDDILSVLKKHTAHFDAKFIITQINTHLHGTRPRLGCIYDSHAKKRTFRSARKSKSPRFFRFHPPSS